MKIGILTYHNTTNYGAILQSYALQKKAYDLGYECEVIDYKCDKIEETYKTKSIFQIKSIKEMAINILTRRNNKKIKELFNEFKEKNIKISKETYNKDNIKKANNKYDIFITGSDQVWNMNLNGNDKTYLLDFVEKEKIRSSYAASFGYEEIPKRYLEENIKELEKFNKISVREDEGKKIVESITNKKALTVLDPTFLLTKLEWNKVIKDVEKQNKDFILLYIVTMTPSIINFVKELRRKTGLEIIYINNTHRKFPGIKNKRGTSVEDFLWYIQNAKYVVTTSFHGVALSLKFEKNFFYECSNQKGNLSSRIRSVINKCELNEREIIEGKCDKIYENIDYKKVTAKLNKEIEKSVEFLKRLGETNG